MNKYSRYRRKCVQEGRCPHCGKPCAPYYECDDRRAQKRILYVLHRLRKAGLISRESHGRGCEATWRKINGADFDSIKTKISGRTGDSRKQPRLNNRPVDSEAIFLEILRANSDGLHEHDIFRKFGELRVAAIEARVAPKKGGGAA